MPSQSHINQRDNKKYSLETLLADHKEAQGETEHKSLWDDTPMDKELL